MTQETLLKCFVMSGVIMIIAIFGNIFYLVNNYEHGSEKISSPIIAAFDG